uniref:NADH dehydrogenase (Ubiquinone) 1 alpha subcomplex, assembly factor 2 n=1 Tax=Nothobranchius pienaari TaxID=704102 RepID=A0A1A8N0Q7_9TELE
MESLVSASLCIYILLHFVCIIFKHVHQLTLASFFFVFPGRHVRAKRIVEAANPAEHEYTEGSIPIEWDAWIRGRRKEPPTIEELLMNEAQFKQIKLKAKALEEKERALQDQEYKEGLVAAPARTAAKGHAAATIFGKQEISEEPTSTADAFQPGSWMPTSKKQTKKST